MQTRAAKVGELIVLVEEYSSTSASYATTRGARYRVGIATKVSRTGLVKEYEAQQQAPARVSSDQRIMVVPGSAPWAREAYAALGGSDWIDYFDSAQEAEDAIRPFVR